MGAGASANSQGSAATFAAGQATPPTSDAGAAAVSVRHIMQAFELSPNSTAGYVERGRTPVRSAPQVQGWCSWCCQWQYHQLVEECLLTRDVHECQGCCRRTLPCRIGCGAFSRGFDLWDEERCAACQGRVRRARSCHPLKIAANFISGVRLVRGLPHHSLTLARTVFLVQAA
jgi:hypothetical protein